MKLAYRSWATGSNPFKTEKHIAKQNQKEKSMVLLYHRNPTCLHYNGHVCFFLPLKNQKRLKNFVHGGRRRQLLTLYSTTSLNVSNNYPKLCAILQTYKEVPEIVNDEHYNTTLKTLARACEWRQLRTLWNTMMDMKVVPTKHTYEILIIAYCNAGLGEECLYFLECMMSQGFLPDELVIVRVVNLFRNSGEHEKADKIYQDWLSRPLNHYKGIIHPCKTQNAENVSQDTMKAKNATVFLDKQSINDNGPLVWWSCSSYNKVIDRYGKAGRLREAFAIFCKMLKLGVRPNTVTFNTMIHNCGTQGKLSDAVVLFGKMEELSCVPDTKTLNILMSLHIKTADVDRALYYFKTMKKSGVVPDTVSYKILLRGLCCRRLMREVEDLVSEIDESGLRVDEHSQVCVMRMYVDLKVINKAWEWFMKFHHSGHMSSECYAANIDAFGEHGYWSIAENAFNSILEKRGMQSTLEFNVMIKAYGIAKLHGKALKLFELMEAQGVLLDRFTYCTIIQICANVSLVELSRGILEKMLNTGLVPNNAVFRLLIAAYGRSDRAGAAEEIYQLMLDRGIELDVTIYGALINVFAEAGCMEKAAHYFQRLQGSGYAGNFVVYSSLIKGYTKAGLVKDAEEIYRGMKKWGIQPDVFISNCMIDLYTRTGMIVEAQEIFQHLREKQCANEFAFALMTSLYRNNGRHSEAMELAKEMFNLGLVTNVLSYNNVISILVADGREKTAAEVFRHMLKHKVSPNAMTFKILSILLKHGKLPTQAIEQIFAALDDDLPNGLQSFIIAVYSVVGMHAEALDNCKDNYVSVSESDLVFYNVVIYAFISARKINEAFQIFAKMQCKGLRPDMVTYMTMISGFAKYGYLEGMIRILTEMKQEGFMPNGFIYTTIINSCKRAKRPDLARSVSMEMWKNRNFHRRRDSVT